MTKKIPKFLIETSAVRPALGSSTPAHERHFAETVAGGELWTSAYIRKEFIQRWICDTLRAAFTLAQCSTTAEALVRIEQDFKPRAVKGLIAVLARYLNETGSISNSPRRAAEELASLAIRWLKDFDATFPKRINNSCQCQIGSRPVDVDYDELLKDAHSFYEVFRTPVTDCGVNDFLQLGNDKGRLKPFLVDPDAGKHSSVRNAKDMRDRQQHVTCKECATIGDVVIALEQPRSHVLVHIDGSFNDLCRCMGRAHQPIKSVTAIAK